MGIFRCPINHELVDTGIEQELAFVPVRKFGKRKTNRKTKRPLKYAELLETMLFIYV